jgi:hypothetical protein
VAVKVRRERRWTSAGAVPPLPSQSAHDSCSAGPAIKCFYEKVINVKADVAAYSLYLISAPPFPQKSLR